MPTMGNAFGVIARSGFCNTGAAGHFFRTFGPDAFFMGRILKLQHAASCVSLFSMPGSFSSGYPRMTLGGGVAGLSKYSHADVVAALSNQPAPCPRA